MRAMAVGAVVGMAFAAMGTAMARSAEDDLAVVKRAVQVAPAVEAEDDDAEVARRIEPRRSTLSSRDIRWFKVRVTEKGKKNARVNINLPIALVRALGDDFPIDLGRHVRGEGWGGDWRDGERRSRSERVIRLGDVLATLEAGQSLVEIDDDEATVRVWVE